MGVRIFLGIRFDDANTDVHGFLKLSDEQLANACLAGQGLIGVLEKAGFKQPEEDNPKLIERPTLVKIGWPTC